MSWTSLKIAPGLVRDTTRYATSGTWFDGSLVRFREGLPEKWAGWVDNYPGFQMDGMCRSIHRHGILDGTIWTSAGTSSQFYMISDEFYHSVAPISISADLANPFTTVAGSKIVKLTDADHGRFPGDHVIVSGATGFAGIPTASLNREFEISGWGNEGEYYITVDTAATASATGGDATVHVDYLFRSGSNDAMSGGGWGRLVWSGDEWGGDPNLGLQDQMGIWSQDNWGEDLVACANGGPIFYWDATFPSNRMIDINDLAGADENAPDEAQFIVVSHRDRHLLAFGCTLFGGVTVEPMTFRWCNQEDIYNWDEGDSTGTAGSLPLSNGSKFLAGLATTREILVWTDQALYSIQFIGYPYIYTADLLDRWSDILGMKAACSYNGVVYWMGRGGFYAYTGRTEKMPCPIWDYIRGNINMEQSPKVYASSNQNHNEVLWFYPSKAGVENDSYACFDVSQNLWTFGVLPRTAWFDSDPLNPVVAASPAPDARLYEHDNGADDGSTNPISPVQAYIESGPIELSAEGQYDKGDRMMFIRKILPDVTFREHTSTSQSPHMNITLRMMDKPGGGFSDSDSSTSEIQRSTTIIVAEKFTEEAHVRLRGRSMTLRAESNSLGTNWRLGIVRIDARTDGQR